MFGLFGFYVIGQLVLSLLIVIRLNTLTKIAKREEQARLRAGELTSSYPPGSPART